MTAQARCSFCGATLEYGPFGASGETWHHLDASAAFDCADAAGDVTREAIPDTYCDTCGIGPFFYIPERDYPRLCIDHAHWRRVEAREGRTFADA